MPRGEAGLQLGDHEQQPDAEHDLGDHERQQHQALLYGTMRQELINNGTILEKEIRKEDIGKFERYKSINAMVSFSLQPQSVKNIVE